MASLNIKAMTFDDTIGVLNANMNMSDTMSPLGSPIVLQRKGSVYGANVPMITGKYTFFVSQFGANLKKWHAKPTWGAELEIYRYI